MSDDTTTHEDPEWLRLEPLANLIPLSLLDGRDSRSILDVAREIESSEWMARHDAEVRAKALEGAPEVRPDFWVLSGGFFKQGGHKFSGPYSSIDDAYSARSSLEKLVPETFWVDSEDATP